MLRVKIGLIPLLRLVRIDCRRAIFEANAKESKIRSS